MVRKFLFKLLGFGGLFLILMMALFFVFSTIETTINRDINNGNTIAIIGHSHPQTAINDSLLSIQTSKEFKNYSEGGQSMFWTIIGGRKLKHQGTKIFVIELTNSTYTSGWKTYNQRHASREVHKKFFLETSEWKDLAQENLAFTSELFGNIKLPRKKINGSFLKHEMTFKEKLVKENNSKDNTFKPDFDDTIVHNFIKNNDSIFFVILRVPQHPKFYTTVGENNEKYFLEQFKAFEAYDNCAVMDFGHKYKSDDLFADLGHMNYDGATVFTKFLADTLTKIPRIVKH